MRTPLQLAKVLREGKSLSMCDSILVFQSGRFEESSMTYSTYIESHTFTSTYPTWLQVRRWLKNRAYH